jgi:hypothetical protein
MNTIEVIFFHRIIVINATMHVCLATIYHVQPAYNPAIFFNIANSSLPVAWHSAWNFDDLSARRTAGLGK